MKSIFEIFALSLILIFPCLGAEQDSIHVHIKKDVVFVSDISYSDSENIKIALVDTEVKKVTICKDNDVENGKLIDIMALFQKLRAIQISFSSISDCNNI